MAKTEIILSAEQLRKLQLEQLELLKEVDRICRKNNIPYYITGGTMLGAVRHKGFIPWDDDIDVSMLRKDYHRFCVACGKDLDTNRFFLQTWDTDKHYRYQYGRLRRNNTLYIRSGHEDAKHHNGINIDLFPVDNVPDNRILCRIYKTGCEVFRKTLYSPVGAVRTTAPVPKLMYRFLSSFDGEKVKVWFKNWIKFFGKFPSSRVDAVGFAYRLSTADKEKLGKENYYEMYHGMKRELVTELTEYSFEGLKFYGVKDYDYYLRTLYGDYMTPPPADKRTGEHKAVAIKFSDEGENKNE
ncbi:MAG: LicD family protein [Lachnospiraceae bacterium]|nr:LicD family protein [Lachnospiraceae bacterium]